MNFDSGDTAWMLVSSALVLFMTPGVGFFYSGMVRAKNALGVLMQSFMSMAIATVVWVVIGFTVAFGPDVAGLLGGLHFWGFANIKDAIPGYDGMTIPPILFAVFQLTFAMITPALFTGAIAERMKFAPFIALVALWSIVVYAPIAHWVFSPNGWLAQRGAQDFAGGAVVHINSGAAALALALVLGKRKGWMKAPMTVHNVPFVLLGAAILFFGWFGFNAGSALKADGVAAFAAANTTIAAATAFLSWVIIERIRGGRVTALGSASGIVAGLVAITPAAGFVAPIGALGLGLVAGVICNLACGIKFRFGFDDALDVIGVHLVGGIVGGLAVGFIGDSAVAGKDGLFYGGGFHLLGEQALSVVAVFAFSYIVTVALAKVLGVVFKGLRINEQQEDEGLDLAIHGEVAYDFGYGTGTLGGSADEEAIAKERIGDFQEHRTGLAERRFGVHKPEHADSSNK